MSNGGHPKPKPETTTKPKPKPKTTAKPKPSGSSGGK